MLCGQGKYCIQERGASSCSLRDRKSKVSSWVSYVKLSPFKSALWVVSLGE